MEIKSGWCAVTPALAEAWLATNVMNRNPRAKAVGRYAGDMKAGRWIRNPQPIIFDMQGRLMDGQHRLLAVILSGMTTWMMIFVGADATARNVIDSGIGRRVDDNMTMHGVTSAKEKVAAVRVIASVLKCQGPVSDGATNDWLACYLEGIEWSVAMMAECAASRWQAAVYGALALAWYRDPAKISEFARLLYRGEDMRAGMPEYAIREHLLRRPNSGGNSDRRDAAVRVLSAARARLEGRDYAKVYASADAVEWFASRAPAPPVEERGDTPAVSALIKATRVKRAS